MDGKARTVGLTTRQIYEEENIDSVITGCRPRGGVFYLFSGKGFQSDALGNPVFFPKVRTVTSRKGLQNSMVHK